MTSAAPLDAPGAAFGLRGQVAEGWTLSQEQLLTAALTDHRGRIEFPSYAVLLDSVGGGPNCVVDGDEIWAVTSRLTMSGGAAARLGVLKATSHVLYRDDSSTTTNFTALNSDGSVVCVGSGRTVVIGRGPAEPSNATSSEDVTIPVGDTELPALIPAELDGRTVVAGMASGSLDVGPLGRLLGIRVEAHTDDPVVRIEPARWMANSMDTMHGGVITALIGHGCAIAGQAKTSAGQNYRLSDMTVNFFRSPPVGGVELVVRTQPVRIGGRIGTFAATLADDAGAVYAHALADVHFR